MNLKTLNWLAAFANGAITIGLIIYFLVKKGDITFNTDLYTFHINLNADDPANSVLTASKTWSVTGTLMKVLVIVYFVFTTFFHVLYATNCFGTGAYQRAILNQNNYFRWIEYAISSTIMTFLIAIISGVKGFDTVILLLFANVAMILCGQIVEAASGPNAKQIRIVATVVGWTLLAGIVFTFFYSFFNALQDGKNNNFDIPTWVYLVIFPLVIWYASFGIVSILQAFVGKHNVEQYMKYEKWYILLSFLSKINLGLFIAFGLNRPKAEKVD